jgi:hypothetical protein
MAILSPPKTSMLFFLAILEGVLTMPIRKFFQDLGKREIALVILTGLVVAWVRHGLQYHWKLWDSWRNFFTSWFVHATAVFLLMVVALWAIIYTHKFFLGRDMEGNYARQFNRLFDLNRMMRRPLAHTACFNSCRSASCQSR